MEWGDFIYRFLMYLGTENVDGAQFLFLMVSRLNQWN